MRGVTRAATTALACLVLACLPGSVRAADQGTQFKVGWILPQVGPVAEMARDYIDGAQVALAMVNESGGIGGLPARLIICDSQNQEQQAVLCTKKLINEDQVNLLLGANGTPQTVAILPTVEAAGIPLFALAGGRVAWVPVKKWVFKSIAANDDQVPAELDFALARGLKRAALIRDNSVFGTDTSDTVKAIAKQKGVEIIIDEVYAPSDTDVTAQVTRLRAANPDIILNLAQNLTAAVMVSKKIVQLGMKTPIMLGTNNAVDTYAKLVPAAVAQSCFAGSKLVLKALPDSDPLAPTIRAFTTRYHQMRGPEAQITANTIPAADALLFVQTVSRPLGARVLDKATLRDAIEGARHVPGLQGFWTESPTDHGTSFADGMVTIRYENGAWTLP